MNTVSNPASHCGRLNLVISKRSVSKWAVSNWMSQNEEFPSYWHAKVGCPSNKLINKLSFQNKKSNIAATEGHVQVEFFWRFLRGYNAVLYAYVIVSVVISTRAQVTTPLSDLSTPKGWKAQLGPTKRRDLIARPFSYRPSVLTTGPPASVMSNSWTRVRLWKTFLKRVAKMFLNDFVSGTWGLMGFDNKWHKEKANRLCVYY